MKPETRLLSSFYKQYSSSPSTGLLPYSSIPGPRPLPFIGNIWRYLPFVGQYKMDTLFENALFNQKHYGPIVREDLMKNHTILHLFDPKDVERFVRQDGKYPHRRSHRALLKYRLDRPDIYRDGGLFCENGPSWYRQRNQFQRRLLSIEQVSANIQKLDQVSCVLRSKIENLLGNNCALHIENFDKLIYEWALGSTLAVFLDININSMDKKLVHDLTEELHNSLTAIDGTEIKSNKWTDKPSKCPYYRMLVQSQEVLYKFVSEQVEQRKTREVPEVSYLNDWLNIDGLNKSDVISLIMDALMAGLHTTTYTVAFLLYHISENRLVQDKLREEIERNLPSNEPITMSQIDSLHYLKNCLKETMRINPVSIGTGRLTTKELALRNYEIPNNVMVITQNQVISRNNAIFNSPHKFDPGRWSHYRTCPRDQRPSPFASLPFGFGARSCIGQRLAELQIKILASRLIQCYNIIGFPKGVPVKTTLIHNIDGPFSVKLGKR